MTQISAEQLVEKVACKHKELTMSADKLKIRRHKFVAAGLLDYFLTQINPSQLAEYKNAREKGKV